MSRYDPFGNNRCAECVFFERKAPHSRCYHIDNFKDGYHFLGPIFMKRPENMNYNQKCKWFKKERG